MYPKRRAQTKEYNTYYETYIGQVPGDDFLAVLEKGKETVLAIMQSLKEDKWNYRYAEGKWTVKEVFIHIIDTERIFAYRAMCIARGDKTALPGFEQDDYIPTAQAAGRSVSSVIQEYLAVRDATITLFEGLPEATYSVIGTASNSPLSPLAAGYILAGHEIHHLRVLNERYG